MHFLIEFGKGQNNMPQRAYLKIVIMSGTVTKYTNNMWPKI